jgi:hypothetical protein
MSYPYSAAVRIQPEHAAAVLLAILAVLCGAAMLYGFWRTMRKGDRG